MSAPGLFSACRTEAPRKLPAAAEKLLKERGKQVRGLDTGLVSLRHPRAEPRQRWIFRPWVPPCMPACMPPRQL